jgi:hypothetical protein
VEKEKETRLRVMTLNQDEMETERRERVEDGEDYVLDEVPPIYQINPACPATRLFHS